MREVHEFAKGSDGLFVVQRSSQPLLEASGRQEGRHLQFHRRHTPATRRRRPHAVPTRH